MSIVTETQLQPPTTFCVAQRHTVN